VLGGARRFDIFRRRQANRLACGSGEDAAAVDRIDEDALVIADVFGKKSRSTPHVIIDRRRRRLRDYDATSRGG